MSEVKLCPVCTGSGIVAKGFYERTSDTWTNAGGTEMCRACHGRGYVIIPGEEAVEGKPLDMQGGRKKIE